ncbi:MAG: anaerobic ribonucleoside-triphosphate reductase [Candidatus Bathyarchaeia archaeon]
MRRIDALVVRKSKGTVEPFDRQKIVESLVDEANVDRRIAMEIASEVEIEIRHMDLEFISAPLIREIVNAKLLEYGLEDARKVYTRVGLPVADVERMIAGVHWYSKENANLQRNPETIHKLLADSVIREHTLLKILPIKLSDMHMKGAIHIHELEYFPTRPFCQSHDARFFFKHGFVADGTGTHTAVAGPAKKAEVALLHALKVLQASQVNCGGGQGLHNFTVFMAPYLRGLDYSTLKQLAQTMFFELGEMYVARGGQTVFSSVSLEPGIPKAYQDIPAIGPGGKEVGVYSDYADETTRFFDAIVEVALDGDYMGKPFNWPKLEIRLTRDWFQAYNKEFLLSSQLAAKFGSPYYFNAGAPYMPGEMICTQCCRYYMQHADWNDEHDLLNGTLRGGVIQNITVNLPQCAYEADGDDDRLFEEIDRRMAASRDVLLIKINEMKKRLAEGFLPFLSQPVDDNPYKIKWYDYEYIDDDEGQLQVKSSHEAHLAGTPYLVPERQGATIGVLGLNEMLKAHIGSELHESRDAWKFGLKVINRMRRTVDEYTKATGVYFGLVQSPAESCAHRLALIDLRTYGRSKVVVQGNPDNGEQGVPAVYYTNSTHVRVSAPIALWERIRIEASFHPLFNGGTILHVFLGEAYPDPEAVWKLTECIATKTLTGYFTYTRDLTICKRCKTVHSGLQRLCPNCNAGGADLEHWSRITGYYQEVSGWNAGKKAELMDRYRHDIKVKLFD